eukprot:GHVT01090277.1.p1 GENE.GHVT01090277.1~~GHVT01090277.1.p1  ORF type:complete len:720 (+),score=145.66 GHVT01090277.1:851-3010(+)
MGFVRVGFPGSWVRVSRLLLVLGPASLALWGAIGLVVPSAALPLGAVSFPLLGLPGASKTSGGSSALTSMLSGPPLWAQLQQQQLQAHEAKVERQFQPQQQPALLAASAPPRAYQVPPTPADSSLAARRYYYADRSASTHTGSPRVHVLSTAGSLPGGTTAVPAPATLGDLAALYHLPPPIPEVANVPVASLSDEQLADVQDVLMTLMDTPVVVPLHPRTGDEARAEEINTKGHDERDVVTMSTQQLLQLKQLNDTAIEQLEGQIFDRVYEASKGQIPAWDETRIEIHDLISSAIKTGLAADWSFPLQAIVAATMEGGVYPTIAPNQRGPVPEFAEIWCNPDIKPCTSLGTWGRTIGIPMRMIYKDSTLGQMQKTVGDVVNEIEASATAGITDPFVNFIEMEPTVHTLEVMASAFFPLFTFKPDDPTWLLARNVTETVVWTPLDLVDKPDQVRQRNQLLRDKIRAARWCRMFNGRLPNCMPTDAFLPSLPNVPHDPVIDPGTGFLSFIFLWGFELSCRFQSGCVAGTPALEPSNFDGVYALHGVDVNGQPVYAKDFPDELFPFKDFNSIQRLFFFQENFRYSNPLVFPNAGAWAGITPNDPSFNPAFRGARPPFTWVLPGDESPSDSDSLALQPPPPCTAAVGTVADGNLATTFPLCLNFQDRWRFGRASGTACGGVQYNNLCFFPTLIQVFPTNQPLRRLEEYRALGGGAPRAQLASA